MAKETKVSTAPLLSTNKEESVIERVLESVGKTNFGELIAEVVKNPKGKKTFINRYIYQDSGDQKICIPITYAPFEIDPDMLYPYREYKMTTDRFNNMDYVPAGSWVREMFRDDKGATIRDASGNPVFMYFWCVLKLQALKEEEECTYGPIKYVLGSSIIKFNEAKNFTLDDISVSPMVGNTRTRVDEDQEIVEIR
jgi:hypothetical protein